MIARKGGPAIQAECDRKGPIKIGEAAITGGGNLPARYVIHAASMCLGGRTTAEVLENCVRACLSIAEGLKLHSIAFPAIGTGIAGFPVKQCAGIMVRILWEHARKEISLDKISLVLWDSSTYDIFVQEYNSIKER
jgi:O-acetyl-ADP-ribose deacetylase (regulator of RNase III)